MLINADFNSIVVVTPQEHVWVDSPQAGVRRIMLDRIGKERARATSLVRYAPGSAFPSHQHPGGEEILVLEGTFTDERGDCPTGWYLRNPPGSQHAPSSREGCLILVKLWQMAANDSQTIRLDTNVQSMWKQSVDRRRMTLFETEDEQVRIERIEAGAPVFVLPEMAAEVLVVAGSLRLNLDGQWSSIPAGSWVRATGPGAAQCLASMVADSQGLAAYVKLGRVVGQPRLPTVEMLA